ncbi:MAG: tRNA (adenosine(37)-N6)-threonylcarbamoyltransferase complex dimerization subunit type 1 TsaB [Pseudomonadota bacterium]
MKLLAIDTATEACTVALVVDGQLASRECQQPRQHGRVLLPWIEQLLASAEIGYPQLDAIAVDRGPGGFTSLRIGLTVAQAIAQAHQRPVYPISSLAALAHYGRPNGYEGAVMAAFDARMGEVYCAWFNCVGDALQADSSEQILSPEVLADQLARRTGPYRALGNAFERYPAAFESVRAMHPERFDVTARPHAESIAALSNTQDCVEASAIQPVYLRDQVTNQGRPQTV